MKKITFNEIKEAVKMGIVQANCVLPTDVQTNLKTALKEEKSDLGKKVLGEIVGNFELAKERMEPVCQDTGIATVFLEVGQDALWEGDIVEAIQEGVREGYREGYFRKSVVRHPLDRINTKDNTPAIIYPSFTKGSHIKMTIMPKGGGSENQSVLKMLNPADGVEGVMDFILTAVKERAAKACPPVELGIGIGGDAALVVLLAKKALAGIDVSTHPIDIGLASKILKESNKLNIGPMGLGGNTTVTAVHICSAPCHIAALPVALVFQCHAARHYTVEL